MTTKSKMSVVKKILDKNLERIVDANFNGYNYTLNKEALDQLYELLVSELPEKETDKDIANSSGAEEANKMIGYNQAIDQIKANYDRLFGRGDDN